MGLINNIISQNNNNSVNQPSIIVENLGSSTPHQQSNTLYHQRSKSHENHSNPKLRQRKDMIENREEDIGTPDKDFIDED